jgi:hypothetical protein
LEDIDFEWILLLNKLQELGLERKISWTLNVFTLGPMAQATLCKKLVRKFVVYAEGALYPCQYFYLCVIETQN